MSGTSKPHGANNSRSTESDIDETVTLIVMALTKGLAVLLWWSVLFPMISIPVFATLLVGFRYGPVFGLILAAFITVQVAANRLAVSRWMVYRLIWDQQVKSVQIGRCRRIVRQSFEDYLAGLIEGAA